MVYAVLRMPAVILIISRYEVKVRSKSAKCSVENQKI